MTHFFTHHGLPLLFAVVMMESFGVPRQARRRWSRSACSPLGATAVGLTAYYPGQAAANAIQRYGLYAGGAVVVAVVVGWFGARYVRRRVEERL